MRLLLRIEGVEEEGGGGESKEEMAKLRERPARGDGTRGAALILHFYFSLNQIEVSGGIDK